MNLDRFTEEINFRGAASIGPVLNSEEVNWFVEDLNKLKKEDIETYGIDKLVENGGLETIQDLARLHEKYRKIIASPIINKALNNTLNDKAVIHSFNAIILDDIEKSTMVGHGFHRDMPWFKDTRTSVIVMIPLVDYSEANGSTKYVPGSHLMPEMPSLEYLENHEVNTVGKAGEAFMVDSTTWHRAGNNTSGKARPMIVLKYTLAPFKQQIEFYLSNPDIANYEPLVRQRLGYNVRVPHNFKEDRNWDSETRKFKSGQYDMTNTYLK